MQTKKTNLDVMIEDQTLIYQGYQKALKAVSVNGTSMVVINTICDLVTVARDERYKLLKMKKETQENKKEIAPIIEVD